MVKGRKKKNKNNNNYNSEMYRQFQAQYFGNYDGYWNCKEYDVSNFIDCEWDLYSLEPQVYNWTCTDCSCAQTFYFYSYNCIQQQQ